MTREEAKALYKHYFSNIKRDGAKKLLRYMEENGFFDAPASRGHHGAYPGGLAEHSINVFRRLVWLEEKENSQKGVRMQESRMETLAVCALLHDLCKIDAYRRIYKAGEDGKQPGRCQYEVTGDFPIGHGEKSVILILRVSGMELTEEEMLAIRWHMGAYDFCAKGGSYDLNNAFKQCKLAAMLHMADMMATHMDEREENSGGVL